MKSFLIMADAATADPGGTVSILRAGVDRLTFLMGQPVFFRGALVLFLEGEGDEKQRDTQCYIACSKLIIPEPESVITSEGLGVSLPESGKIRTLVFNIELSLPGSGDYEMAIKIENLAASRKFVVVVGV